MRTPETNPNEPNGRAVPCANPEHGRTLQGNRAADNSGGVAMKATVIVGSRARDGFKVPCGFLVSTVGNDGKADYRATACLQSDWEYLALAQDLGFQTDDQNPDTGAAYGFLAEREGQVFDTDLPLA